MKGEDRIIELLTESVQQQERMNKRLEGLEKGFYLMGERFDELKGEFSELNDKFEDLHEDHKRTNEILAEHGQTLKMILETLSADVVHYNHVMRLEDLGDGKVVLRTGH